MCNVGNEHMDGGVSGTERMVCNDRGEWRRCCCDSIDWGWGRGLGMGQNPDRDYETH